LSFIFLGVFGGVSHATLLEPEFGPEFGILENTSHEVLGTYGLLSKSTGVDTAINGLEETAKKAKLKIEGAEKVDYLPKRIGQILSVVIGLVGVIFLILTIYGGFMWMTAGGNKEQVGMGVSYIKNGAIGVVIILLSYAFVTFIFNQLINNTP